MDPREHKRLLGDVAHWAYQGRKTYVNNVTEIIGALQAYLDHVATVREELPKDGENILLALAAAQDSLAQPGGTGVPTWKWEDHPEVLGRIVGLVYETGSELHALIPVPKARRKKQ